MTPIRFRTSWGLPATHSLEKNPEPRECWVGYWVPRLGSPPLFSPPISCRSKFTTFLAEPAPSCWTANSVSTWLVLFLACDGEREEASRRPVGGAFREAVPWKTEAEPGEGELRRGPAGRVRDRATHAAHPPGAADERPHGPQRDRPRHPDPADLRRRLRGARGSHRAGRRDESESRRGERGRGLGQQTRQAVVLHPQRLLQVLRGDRPPKTQWVAGRRGEGGQHTLARVEDIGSAGALRLELGARRESPVAQVVHPANPPRKQESRAEPPLCCLEQCFALHEDALMTSLLTACWR